jgi:hypothetical protein
VAETYPSQWGWVHLIGFVLGLKGGLKAEADNGVIISRYNGVCFKNPSFQKFKMSLIKFFT